MGNYICFENKGEVPVNAFKLLGASSKRGDASKIGYFGTGLKYAIAVMLRQDIDFKVFSGTKEVRIGVRNTKFLDSNVSVMTVNGEKTSITLDAGIDWEPWFSIREIYSNTIDENGAIKFNVEPESRSNYTRIFIDIEAESLKGVFDDWNNYFSKGRSFKFKNTVGKLLPKLPSAPEYTVFRKGIRVHSSRKHSVFDYDLEAVQINESRVAVYAFQVHESCSEVLAASQADCIKEFLRLSHNARRSEYIEWQDDFWDYTSEYAFSEAWLEALSDKRLVPANFAGHYDITETTQIVPDKLLNKLKKRFGDGINTAGDNRDKFVVLKANKEPLQKMLDAFALAGFDWQLEDIDIVKFNDQDLLGMAKDGRVLLSSNLFTAVHRHQVAATLIEEIVHAKTGLNDGTRQMQNYLFNVITNLTKQLHEVKT